MNQTEEQVLIDPMRCVVCKETNEWEEWVKKGRKCPSCDYDPYFAPKGKGENMTLSVDAMQAGECIFVRTPTAEYWLLLLGNLVASVYRKGNGEEYATLLEKRRMSNRITQGEGFMMFNSNNEPVSSIIVNTVQKVPADTIPFRKGA